MKKLFAFLIVLLIAGSVSAGPVTAPVNRFVILTAYTSDALAASDLASGYPKATMVRTTSAAQPWLRFQIVYADFVAILPPAIPVRYAEMPAGPSALQNAQAYVNWYRQFYAHVGVVYTTEETVLVYWF